VENNYKNNDIPDFLKKNNFKYLVTIGADQIYINRKFKNLIRNKLITNSKILFLKSLEKTKLTIKKVINKNV